VLAANYCYSTYHDYTRIRVVGSDTCRVCTHTTAILELIKRQWKYTRFHKGRSNGSQLTHILYLWAHPGQVLNEQGKRTHNFGPTKCHYTLHTISLHAGECRALWGEPEQAVCISATEERMRYHLKVSEVMIVVGSLWWHIIANQ